MPGAKSLKELRDKTLGKWKEDKAGNLTKKEEPNFPPAGSATRRENPRQGTDKFISVYKGETLGEIAGAYGTTADAIAKANKIEDKNKISIGQELDMSSFIKSE